MSISLTQLILFTTKVALEHFPKEKLYPRSTTEHSPREMFYPRATTKHSLKEMFYPRATTELSLREMLYPRATTKHSLREMHNSIPKAMSAMDNKSFNIKREVQQSCSSL